MSFCGILDYVGNTEPIESLPRFHVRFIWDSWTIHYVAQEINHLLIERLVKRDFDASYIQPSDFKAKLNDFLSGQCNLGKITIAAKNPEFDNGFLKALGFNAAEYRYIDPAILYLRSKDARVPGLATCLQRAGLDASGIHNEVFDAESVIRLMRKFDHV